MKISNKSNYHNLLCGEDKRYFEMKRTKEIQEKLKKNNSLMLWY